MHHCLVIWLLLMLVSYVAGLSSFATSGEISDVVAAPNRTLLIAAGSSLSRVASDNFNLVESMSFGSKAATVGVKWSGEDPNTSAITVVCLSNQSYLIFNSTQGSSLLTNLLSHVMMNSPSSPTLSNDITLHLDDDSFYTGKFGLVQIFNKNFSFLGQFGYNSNSGILRTGKYPAVSNYHRSYKSTFKFGDFIYFVAEDRQNNIPSFTITRLCTQLTTSSENIEAVYEASLSEIPTNTTSRLVNVQLMEGIGATDIAVVVICVSTDQNSGIYALRLTDLDKKMMTSYNKCKMHRHSTDSVNIPWMDSSQNCEHFGVSQVQPCDFNSFASNVEVLYSNTAGTPYPVLQLEKSVTASLLINHSDALYLYTAHTNTTSFYIAKYLVTVSTSGMSMQYHTTYLHQIETPQAVKRFLWTEQSSDTVYYATSHQVHKFPVDECPEHSTCSQCASSANPLCGWCTLEGTCGALKSCQNGSLSLRWVSNESQCPDVSVATKMIPIDGFNKIPLNITKGLPALLDGESYNCSLTNQSHNISVSVQLKHQSCQLPLSIPNIQFLSLQISLTGPLSSKPIVTNVGSVIIVECSQATRCTSCLELSTVCGWCKYRNRCTGNATLCEQESNWLTLADSATLATEVCPVVVLPPRGVYNLQVGNIKQFVLKTNNTPPEDANHRYKCVLNRHGKETLGYGVEANSLGADSIACNFTQSQVNDIEHFSERATVNLIWSNHTVEVLSPTSRNISTVIPVLLYNCSAVALDCSSCVRTSLLQELDCGWCTTLNKCSPVNGTCPSPVTIDTNTCPAPILQYITSPNTGPTAGGTVITIYGKDLGVLFSDIVSISIGNQSCTPLNNTYISGARIQCTTGLSSSSGNMSITVTIRRGDSLIVTNSSKSVMFSYLQPSITDSHPLRGPVAGGSRITVRGTYLNIGNTSRTRVLLGDTECKIKNLQTDRIECVTGATSTTGEKPIIIHIDDAVIQKESVVFEYTKNPYILNLHPNKTIPAGGITLYFIGQHMDVVENPSLQLVYNHRTYSTVCQPANTTHLSCKAPQLSTAAATIVSSLPLDYVLLLDAVETPNQAELPLSLRPNPDFSHIFYTDTERPYQGNNPIRIMGNHIDSVLTRELRVKIGDQDCHIVSVNSKVLSCLPPNVSQHTDEFSASIVVNVANNTLTFSVGRLHYLKRQQPVLTTAATVIIAVVLLMLSIVIMIVAAVGVKCWTRKHPPLRNLTKRSELKNREAVSSKILERSIDPNNDYCDLIVDNIYESVTDAIYQNNSPIKARVGPLPTPKYLLEKRPASDNLNLSPIYQNPHVGLIDGPYTSSSSPNIAGMTRSPNHAIQTQVTSLAMNDETDGGVIPSRSVCNSAKDENCTCQQNVEYSSVALRTKRQQAQGKKMGGGTDLKTSSEEKLLFHSISLETNEDYVEMRSSKGSPHPWDHKMQANDDDSDVYVEPASCQLPVEEHYVTMRSASESSAPKSPIEIHTAEVFEYPSTNPLYSNNMSEPCCRDDVFSTSGDYVAMKRIN